MKNIPIVKLGIVAVSRNCFPEELAITRRQKLVEAYSAKYSATDIYECPICIIESELHMERALKNIEKEGCNALCVYLGNFGPEIAETILAEKFQGPVMFCAAAEESQEDLIDGRGDAYCGLLNASYNLHLRKVKAHIPENPVGSAEACADMIHDFMPIARTILGLNNLKIISFGPRPSNFMACNAPIQPLYDLKIEIEENSELDLFEAFQKHENDARISALVDEMTAELGVGNTIPEILPKLAQYELTLLDWIRTHKGSRKYVVLTTKCWPAFQTQFQFVPCYVNSRLTAKGFPVACEVDVYGALSEYIGTCITQDAVTILDMNNTIPHDMFLEHIQNKPFLLNNYTEKDLFMGFHCGNTSICKLSDCKMCNQHIMSRSLPDDLTKGTIEGDLIPGEVTIFRLQGTSDSELKTYMAQGEILPVKSRSFGNCGVFAIKDMNRFYRHVLIEHHFPHHAAILYGLNGKYLFEIMKYIGIPYESIFYNKEQTNYYPSENPFY